MFFPALMKAYILKQSDSLKVLIIATVIEVLTHCLLFSCPKVLHTNKLAHDQWLGLLAKLCAYKIEKTRLIYVEKVLGSKNSLYSKQHMRD